MQYFPSSLRVYDNENYASKATNQTVRRSEDREWPWCVAG